MALKSDAKWQDKALNVEHALRYMYQHEILGDVIIQAINTKVEGSMCFSAHKVILASRSPVFEDLFYNKTGHSSIMSVNFSPRAIDILLWYIYSDTVEGDNIEELIESFEAAIYYQISSFYENCAEKIQSLSPFINSNNVCSVLKIANYSKSKELRITCLQFIEKEPERTFLSEGLVWVSQKIVLTLLNKLSSSLCSETKLKIIIKWMLHNKVYDRKLLSEIDLTAFSAEEFLNTIEEIPDLQCAKEIRSILSHLMGQQSPELSLESKLSKSRNQKGVSSSLYREMELHKKHAVNIVTNISQCFSKCTLHSLYGFEQDILLKVIIRSDLEKLVMLELAFGSEYIPPDNLTLELCCNTGEGKKMESVKCHLIPTLNNYYLLFDSDVISRMGKKFNLLLKLGASELSMWDCDGLISNQKYRIASVMPDSEIIKAENAGIFQMANLKSFSEWILFINPKNGEKKFIISALFLNNPTKIEKINSYM